MRAPRSLVATLLALSAVVPVAIAPSVATAQENWKFTTLAPGTALPSEATCRGLVRPTAEIRPENADENAFVPPLGAVVLEPMHRSTGYDDRALALEHRVTGNFTGTTDEIIQWASCKWGFDEDIARAMAVNESWWEMSQLGDYTSDPTLCAPGYVIPCPKSFGILQVGIAGDPLGNYPWSKLSTAFNLDAALMAWRVCYEGYTVWLNKFTSDYGLGDLWGCVGTWYSGRWHDAAAKDYISRVRGFVASRPWAHPWFSSAPLPTTERYDFEGGSTQGWYPGRGSPVTSNTTPAYRGSGALAIDLGTSGATKQAVQVAYPRGLEVGDKVVFWIYRPADAAITDVLPYVADSSWRRQYAPPAPLLHGWNQVTWIVPWVRDISAMGLLVKDDSGWRGRLVLDSVRW